MKAIIFVIDDAISTVRGDLSGKLGGHVLRVIERAPVKGKVMIDAKMNHFVVPKDFGGKKILVKKDKLNGAGKGDIVEAHVLSGFEDGHMKGEVLRVLEKGIAAFVDRYRVIYARHQQRRRRPSARASF